MDGVKRYFVQLFKLGGDEQRYAHGALGAVEIVRASDFDAALDREVALREELAEYKDGFFQKVTDEDLKKISDFVGNGDLPTNSFFMRADAGNLANMTMHMVREVQSLRIGLTAADQRNVELEAELGPTMAQIRASNKAVAAQLKQGEGRCKFDVLWKSGGSAVDATITEEQYSQILKILHPEVSGVSDAFHATLKPTESGASE